MITLNEIGSVVRIIDCCDVLILLTVQARILFFTLKFKAVVCSGIKLTFTPFWLFAVICILTHQFLVQIRYFRNFIKS